MTISDLNIQDDKMIISCEVGIYCRTTDPRKICKYVDPWQIWRALHYDFDETTLRVYGKQLIFLYQHQNFLIKKIHFISS